MKNKKNEEIEDLEVIDDESLDFSDFDDEELEDEVEDEKPSKKKQNKKSKKKLNKGAKAGIITASIVVVLIIAFVVEEFTLGFLGIFKKSSNITGDILDPRNINFKAEISSVDVAPSESVAATCKYDLQSILEDSSKSNQYKAAAAVLFSTGNEVFVSNSAYFKYQVGTTNLGENSGTMIYQRIRREADHMKYDTTIKLPINHNFDSTAASFVTDATIRFEEGGLYHKITADSENIQYNTETGMLEVAKSNWKKGDKWHKDSDYTKYLTEDNDDDSYSDVRKIQLYVGELKDTMANSTVYADLIDASTVTIEKKDGYYEIYFEADIEKAANDTHTCNTLDKDNSGKGIKYESLKVTLQVWDCGLAKSFYIDESWSGKVGAAIIYYTGKANSTTMIKYGYDIKDSDCTYAKEIRSSLCSKCA